MQTEEAISGRRSVKHYDPDHQMSDDEIQKLLSLALLSPTAFNIQNWRFVTISDPMLRKQIREVAWEQEQEQEQEQVTDTSLFIVLCANLKAWEQPARYWVNAPKEVQDFMIPAIDVYYRVKEQVQRDEAIKNSFG